MDEDFDPTYFTWLIAARTRNQTLALKLLTLIRSEKAKKHSDDIEESAQALTSVVFSLWRAAFLLDGTDDGLQHADVFLERLVQDNSIGYAQDRKSRHWTGPYYLNHAQFQLYELQQNRWDHLPVPPVGGSLTKGWDKLHDCLEVAVGQFQNDLNAIEDKSDKPE